MRVVVLTSSADGLAPYCISRLAAEPNVELAMIVLSEGRDASAKQRMRRAMKVLKIGPIGALNGIRIRSWFDVGKYLPVAELDTVAEICGARLERTPTINCKETEDLFFEAGAELGLSLGNSYIGRRVYTIPHHGMINIHHEVLPEFQGAQSVIWQIYEGSIETGYSIHRIAPRIDAGEILYQERLPLQLMPTLAETVRVNLAHLFERSAEGLVEVLNKFPELAASASPQANGRTFTTPTFREYRRMVRQHRRLYRESVARA